MSKHPICAHCGLPITEGGVMQSEQWYHGPYGCRAARILDAGRRADDRDRDDVHRHADDWGSPHPADSLRQALTIMSGLAEDLAADDAELLGHAIAIVRSVAVELDGEEVSEILRDDDGVMAAVAKRMRVA